MSAFSVSAPHGGSDSFFVLLAGTDTYHARHVEHEDFTVADFTGLRGCHDGFHAGIHDVISHNNFDFHFWQEIDHVFSTTVQLGVTFLTAKTFHFGDGHPGNPDFCQRFADIVEFEWLDNRINLFHGGPL